ncbi:MAG: type II toxin-antitoxin system VapC family toxin [Methanocellales archaeon]
MVYLDANVFVFAALATDELGDASRYILANLRKIEAKTSCLTLDELAWAVLRRVDISTAAEACRAVLMLKDLNIASVEYGDTWEMTKAMETWKLKPRDGLHLAIMKRLGEKTIVSEDEHFDKTNVKRISIATFTRSI